MQSIPKSFFTAINKLRTTWVILDFSCRSWVTSCWCKRKNEPKISTPKIYSKEEFKLIKMKPKKVLSWEKKWLKSTKPKNTMCSRTVALMCCRMRARCRLRTHARYVYWIFRRLRKYGRRLADIFSTPIASTTGARPHWTARSAVRTWKCPESFGAIDPGPLISKGWTNEEATSEDLIFNHLFTMHKFTFDNFAVERRL